MTEAFSHVNETMGEISQILPGSEDSPLSESAEEKIDSRGDALSIAQSEFLQTSQRWAGSRPRE